MHKDPVLRQICLGLASDYRAHTILLYGSRADGSYGAESDYDVAAFAPIERLIRDARRLDGAFLDVFVYPEEKLVNLTEDQMRLRGSKILLQRESSAEKLLQALEDMYRTGPQPFPADEIEARRTWAKKMVVRAQKGDLEGHYRRTWLLTALLEDYFHIRGLWYQGPKKSLRWLEEFDPEAHRCFSAALVPGAPIDAIQALVDIVSAV